MKVMLIVAALAGIAFMGVKLLVSGSAQQWLYSMITLRGSSLSGGSLATIALITGGAFIVLAIAYAARSK